MMTEEMTARKMQNLSAKARWAKLTPEAEECMDEEVRSAGKIKKESKKGM